MSNVQVCQFEESLVEELKKFRFSRSTTGRAIVMKIDASKMMLVIDEHYEDTTTEELRFVNTRFSSIWLIIFIKKLILIIEIYFHSYNFILEKNCQIASHDL